MTPPTGTARDQAETTTTTANGGAAEARPLRTATDTDRITARVGRREWGWVVAWVLLVMVLTCVPYGYALKIADGRTFGGFLWGVDEGNVYLAWLRQAGTGEVFLRNQYCLAPENPRFFNLFLQAGGRLGAWCRWSPPVTFHVLRLLGGVFLLLCFYRLAAELTSDRTARWAALALASLGSGLGWLVVLKDGWLGLRPVDVGTKWQIQPEAVTFPALLLNGLFTASMGLMCLVFLYAVRAMRDNDWGAVWRGGLCLLLLGNIHTYDVFPVWLALAVLTERVDTGRRRYRRVPRRVLALMAMGVPSVAWALYAAKADPAFMAKGLTPTLAFRFADYAVGYGLIGVLALVGAVLVASQVRDRQPAEGRPLRTATAKGAVVLLPVAWAVANSVVLLAPVSFQRKMIEGLHLPLCLLAGIALARLAERLTRGLRARGKLQQARERVVLTLIAVVVFALPSNVMLAANCMVAARNNNRDLLGVMQPPVYLEAGDAAALRWLRTHTTRDDILLCSSFLGSYVPTYCEARPWVGHWAETLALESTTGYYGPRAPLEAWQWIGGPNNPDGELTLRRFGEQLQAPQALYRRRELHQSDEHLRRLTTPRELAAEIRRLPVSLVYYGPWERAITGPDPYEADPATAVASWLALADKALTKVYDSGGVTIYRVPPAHDENTAGASP